MTGKQQEPTQGVRLREVSQSYGEYSYSKMTEKWQGPTPGVRLREVSIL